MKSKLQAFALAALLVSGASFAKQAQPLNDDTITDQVRIKLSGDQIVKGGALGVDVKDGVVTLTGVVDEPKAKDRAEKLTKKTKGVKQVINKITVK
ncbi:MAG TPA: BON domain-containing protein [Bryobacteraceae bacterium]|nr:BON domain-containing protein [Bryobacteraceae bacterium]